MRWVEELGFEGERQGMDFGGVVGCFRRMFKGNGGRRRAIFIYFGDGSFPGHIAFGCLRVIIVDCFRRFNFYTISVQKNGIPQ